MTTELRRNQLQDLAIHETELGGFMQALKNRYSNEEEKEMFKRNIAITEREIVHLKMLIGQGIELKELFDDVTATAKDDAEGHEYWKYWSQICDACCEKLHIPYRLLDEGCGHGICGVAGCEQEADNYVDFEEY